MDLNKAARRAYNSAIARGKVTAQVSHEETVCTMGEEFEEVRVADENAPSDHLGEYTEVVEELTDVLISSLTELFKRKVNIEEVLHAKLKYNESRS